MWDNCCIMVRELAKIVVISVGSIETIINDELNFSKFSLGSKLLSEVGFKF
jgi:hypothetical protein